MYIVLPHVSYDDDHNDDDDDDHNDDDNHCDDGKFNEDINNKISDQDDDLDNINNIINWWVKYGSESEELWS